MIVDFKEYLKNSKMTKIKDFLFIQCRKTHLSNSVIATCLAGIVWFAIPENGKLYENAYRTKYTNGMQMSCEYVVYKWCANHEE